MSQELNPAVQPTMTSESANLYALMLNVIANHRLMPVHDTAVEENKAVIKAIDFSEFKESASLTDCTALIKAFRERKATGSGSGRSFGAIKLDKNLPLDIRMLLEYSKEKNRTGVQVDAVLESVTTNDFTVSQTKDGLHACRIGATWITYDMNLYTSTFFRNKEEIEASKHSLGFKKNARTGVTIKGEGDKTKIKLSGDVKDTIKKYITDMSTPSEDGSYPTERIRLSFSINDDNTLVFRAEVMSGELRANKTESANRDLEGVQAKRDFIRGKANNAVITTAINDAKVAYTATVESFKSVTALRKKSQANTALKDLPDEKISEETVPSYL